MTSCAAIRADAHRKRWSVGFSSSASTSAHSGTRVCSSARPSSPAAGMAEFMHSLVG